MRRPIDISKNQWNIWLDKDAGWENDKLYVPEDVKTNTLPVNPPTGGWGTLDNNDGKQATLPACIEEYFSGGINNWTYHGVSWYSTQIDIPNDFNGKRVTLHFEKTRLRAEIIVNQKLVGYDLVSETPYDVDITDAVVYGEANQLAIRITNPGGTRGWNDFLSYKWGENEMMPSHDFGVVGHVNLVATDYTYISDVFVKNIQPAMENRLSIKAEIISKEKTNGQFEISILDAKSNKTIFTDAQEINLEHGKNNKAFEIAVPDAKLWDIDTPNLYYCVTKLKTATAEDDVKVRFGFRVFEVLNKNGDSHYYLNGKRFRHKSAIDWGYYAHTGIYATEEMAEKSVQAAKDIGHTGINFHRQIGEPLVMDKADELGLYMFEEPGGIKTGDISFLIKLMLKSKDNEKNLFVIEKNLFAQNLFREKLKRMVLRDRNRPSLLMYCMTNEDKKFTPFRAEMLKLVNELDNSRQIINSSGTNCTAWILKGLLSSRKGKSIIDAKDKAVIKHGIQYNYRPYSNDAVKSHVDIHTVGSVSMFQEDIFESHASRIKGPTRYWGEVGCYCGPANWYQVTKDVEKCKHGQQGYDLNIYKGMHDKLDKYFDLWQLKGTCGGKIQTPGDVSKQAGRGLMYIDGRFSQTLCSYDALDGYAINGWSSGPQVGSNLPKNERMIEDWDSAIVDEGRNLKGPAEDYAYWTRPLQIAIFRNNGKYFSPNEKAEFRIVFINEGKLPKGNYNLKLTVNDGFGQKCESDTNMPIIVEGGDVFSQEIGLHSVTLNDSMAHGHITIVGQLVDKDGKVAADGSEQILLNNPKSYGEKLQNIKIAVYDWQNAKQILSMANGSIEDYNNQGNYDCILSEGVPKEGLDNMLKKAEDGASLVVKFDEKWANELLKAGILSAPVSEWGCEQEGFWYGNGWGYISEYIGNQAVPSKDVIGTNSWEVKSDPQGFYPLESEYKTKVHGLWMARHDILRVILAEISYGKGKIILNTAYEVNEEDILSSLILLNSITKLRSDYVN